LSIEWPKTGCSCRPRPHRWLRRLCCMTGLQKQRIGLEDTLRAQEKCSLLPTTGWVFRLSTRHWSVGQHCSAVPFRRGLLHPAHGRGAHTCAVRATDTFTVCAVWVVTPAEAQIQQGWPHDKQALGIFGVRARDTLSVSLSLIIRIANAEHTRALV